MKLRVFLLFIVIAGIAKGQEDDVYRKTEPHKTDSVIKLSPYNRTQNYYTPFHQAIIDTSKKSNVSKIGVYVSAAFGSGNIAGIYPNLVALFSCSIAYKSHLFTLTRAGYGQLFYGGSQGEIIYQGSYVGLLFGESIRFKYAMVSLSAGLAYSNVQIYENYYYSIPPIVSYQGISLPIELKVFLHTRNGIGLGVHIAKNIITPIQDSPFYFGFGFVFGKYNKVKRTHNSNFGSWN
jgi:hypothetical protein